MLRAALGQWRLLHRSPIGGLFAVNGAILGLGLIGSVQLARWLGPNGRGELAAAMLWPTLLTYLASLGVIHAVVYHASAPEADAGTVFGTAGVLAILQALCAMTVGYLLLPVLLGSQRPEVISLARLYLLVIPFNLLGQYALAMCQANQRFKRLSALRLVLPVGYVVSILVLEVVERLTVRNVIVAHLGFTVIVCAAALVSIRALGVVRGLRASWSQARQLLGYGAKVHAGTLCQTANLRLDQALISAWLAPAQLGFYVAAVSAASINQVLASAVDTVLVPRLARTESARAQRQTLRSVFARYWLLSLAGSLALAAGMPVAIPLVFGPEFAPAVWPAIVLILATFLLGLKDVLAGGARGMGNPWLGSRAEITASVATVVLLPVLLASFGILGAALVMLLTSAAQVLVVVRGLRRTHGIGVISLMRARRVATPS